MPTRGETYRQTWVDPKYELFQANIERAMAEDVRLREDLALQRQFIEKQILQAEKAVDALEKQAIKSFADAGSAIGPKNSDIRGFHALYQSAHKKFLDQYDTPSDLEGAVASLIATAISPEVTAIVDPEDQAVQILAMLRTDKIHGKMLKASSKQREAMANELAALLKESVEGISDGAAIEIAVQAMSTPGKEINPLNVDVSGFTDRINMESRREAVREINPARREAGMSPLDEKTLERLDPTTGKPEAEAVRERSSAAKNEIGAAKTDLEKLLAERTRLTKLAEAPSESDLRQRAIEMNIDIFRKRKDRKPPKDPAELMQFLGRDAIQYIKDQDPTTDGSKAGMLATQINGLLAAGTMRRGQLLEIAGNYAGKDKDLRNEIITRVLAHALKEMASTSADPEAALKPADDPMKVAKEAMQEQSKQQLQVVEQGVEEAKTKLKDAASTPPAPVQAPGGEFSGPNEAIGSLPLNDDQKKWAKYIYDKFIEAGLPASAAYAAIVNAAAESELDPNAVNRNGTEGNRPDGEMAVAVGLFQLNDAERAMGVGMSEEARMNPDINIDTMIEAIKGPLGKRFREGAQAGMSIEELTSIFTVDLENPANGEAVGADRAKTASGWFGRGVTDAPTPPTPRTGVERQTEAQQLRNTQAFDALRIEDFRALLAETTDPIERADLQRTIEGLTKESEVAQAEIDALIQAAPRAERGFGAPARTRLSAPIAPAGADMGAAREGVATKKAQVQAEIDRLKGLGAYVSPSPQVATSEGLAPGAVAMDVAGQQREINKEIARQQQLLDHLQRMEETTLVGEAAPPLFQTALDDDGFLISRTSD